MKINKTESASNKIMITISALAASYLLKVVLENTYKTVFKEDPPSTIKDEKFNWGKIIGWTIVSGIATNAINILVRRSGAHRFHLK